MAAAPATAATEVIVRARTHPWCHVSADALCVMVTVGQDRGVNELKERLRADLTDAMRARDQVRLRTLRMALTSITNEEVSGDSARELSDDEVAQGARPARRRSAGRRPRRSRRPVAPTRPRPSGPRATCWRATCPAQLSDDELTGLVAAAIAETGAVGHAGHGQGHEGRHAAGGGPGRRRQGRGRGPPPARPLADPVRTGLRRRRGQSSHGAGAVPSGAAEAAARRCRRPVIRRLVAWAAAAARPAPLPPPSRCRRRTAVAAPRRRRCRCRRRSRRRCRRCRSSVAACRLRQLDRLAVARAPQRAARRRPARSPATRTGWRGRRSCARSTPGRSRRTSRRGTPGRRSRVAVAGARAGHRVLDRRDRVEHRDVADQRWWCSPRTRRTACRCRSATFEVPVLPAAW